MIQLNSGNVNLFNAKNINKNKKNIKVLKTMIKEYEDNYNLEYIECPDCKCSDYIFYGTYERNLLSNADLRIKIKRVQCKYCHKTHAIIPSFITPYFQHESSYINMVIYMLIVMQHKKQYIEHLLNISRQKIRQWEKRFLRHYSYLKTTYKINTNEDIFEILRQPQLLKKYREENQMRYLEKLPT